MFTQKVLAFSGVCLCACSLLLAGCGNEATTTTTAPPADMPTETEMQELNSNYSTQGTPADRR